MITFKELGISTRLAQIVNEIGFSHPTTIQEKAIPVLLGKNDIIAESETGSGKTLAFLLPIIDSIDPEKHVVQALIVAPTRELALQITSEAEKLLTSLPELKVLAVYGGQDVLQQLKRLEGANHIVIATPGRLLDHVRRETILLNQVSTLVLDEADQMLHMGFLQEVEQVIKETPAERQTVLFSATMPEDIRKLATTYMNTPISVNVKQRNVTLDEIEQIVISTTDRSKQEALKKVIKSEQPFLGIIFCRTKRRVNKLHEALKEKGYLVDALHGDLSQAKREEVMATFREAKIQYLIATDVAARGLDVEGVTHVFNYDIPQDLDSYIHRIGRTGRAGGTGRAFTFVAPKDRNYLAMLEKGINQQLERRIVK
ncbi:ATP-dependent RNA helicase BA2475 [Halalkalibacter akibai JCM 9157]|uniref:RNA helicase n=1 Tax=Halalkalibacter akibai (strain ATCC 43226 / DSM 21942 / CIP 109018 / JCM 9157 / 1139) TaxID=1236973 RepID=W4QQA2_HALA3|nr:ATP-dependent RNA helicase BA2475 [Halalkalibacter akibai JCM 9157]